MNRNWMSTSAVGLALFTLCGVAAAQSTQAAVFATDFSFVVQGHELPPGRYTVAQHDQVFLTLRDGHGKYVASVCANPMETVPPTSVTKVVFYEWGGVHILTSVRWQGKTTGQELVRPDMQIQAAQNFVRQHTSTQALAGK